MSVQLVEVALRRVSRSTAIHRSTSLVFGLACFAVILFALVPATTRIAAAQLSGLSIGLIRSVGAGLFAFPLLLILRLSIPRKSKDWCLLLLCAFGNFAAFPILFGIGVRHTSGSQAALIMATMPLFIGLLGMVLERRLPRWGWFVGATIAIGGETSLVVMGSANSSTGVSVVGDAIVFAACTLSAVGIVAGARLGSRIGPLAATLWAITIGGAALAPWAVLRLLGSPAAYQHLTGITWIAILQITVGAAVIANMAWLWAVARGGLVRVAPMQFAQPVCALIFASALLNERLSPALLLVAVSILVGTVIACRAGRPNSMTKKRDLASLPPYLQNAPSLVPPDPERIRALLKLVQQPAYTG